MLLDLEAGSTMTTEAYIAHLQACGYTVTKRKSRKAKEAPKLNAVGKPYSPSYDPNYKMKYRTPKLQRAQNVSANALSPQQWTEMCKLAAAAWTQRMAILER